MFFIKKATPEIHIDKTDNLLMVKCFVKNNYKARMQCVIEDNNIILIGDILHIRNNRDYNKGYGSLMMNKLILYAMENGYTLIHGNLSSVDCDHKERLHHFYEKYGFSITVYPEIKDCYYGEIRKTLTEVDN